MIKKILTILGLFLLLAGFLWVLNEGIKKHERVECLEWRKQAKEFNEFYWADWQIKQCKEILK